MRLLPGAPRLLGGCCTGNTSLETEWAQWPELDCTAVCVDECRKQKLGPQV